MTNRTRRFLASARWLSAINIAQSVLLLVVGIVLARSIAPRAFGDFAFVLALAEGLSLLTGFGFNTSILQNRTHPDRRFQNTGFFLSALFVGGYAVVSALVGLLLVPGLIFPYLLVVLGKTIFMLSGVHGVLLQKHYEFRITSLIQFGAFLLSSGAAIILALRGYGMQALVAQYVVLQIVIAAATVALSPFRLSARDLLHREYAAVFLRNGRQLFVSQMVEKLLANADKVLINRVLGALGLAFYNRAVGLTQRFQSIFLTVLQPLMMVSFADLQGDRERSGYFFNASTWLMLRASMLITLIFVAAPREFILILYGDNWVPAAALVPLLSVFLFLTPIRALARNFLLSNGRFVPVRNLQVVELGLFLAALALGARAAALEGLCVAVSVWMACVCALYLAAAGRIIRLEVRRVFLLPCTLFVAIAALNALLRAQTALSEMAPLPLALASTGLVTLLSAAGILAFEHADLRALLRKIRS